MSTTDAADSVVSLANASSFDELESSASAAGITDVRFSEVSVEMVGLKRKKSVEESDHSSNIILDRRLNDSSEGNR